jgi:hypothetical protein
MDKGINQGGTGSKATSKTAGVKPSMYETINKQNKIGVFEKVKKTTPPTEHKVTGLQITPQEKSSSPLENFPGIIPNCLKGTGKTSKLPSPHSLYPSTVKSNKKSPQEEIEEKVKEDSLIHSLDSISLG